MPLRFAIHTDITPSTWQARDGVRVQVTRQAHINNRAPQQQPSKTPRLRRRQQPRQLTPQAQTVSHLAQTHLATAQLAASVGRVGVLSASTLIHGTELLGRIMCLHCSGHTEAC